MFSFPLLQDASSMNQTQPLITVIITHYNCTKYLPFAIASITAQSWTNLQIIVIDDCSDEQTTYLQEIIDYFVKDIRVTFICNQVNVGCYVSKNLGIMNAKGDFITFHDADDYSLTTRLELQYNTCRKENLVACYGSYRCRQTGSQKLAEITLFIHRLTFIARFGFFDTVRVGGDTEFRHRLFLSGLRWKHLDVYVYACLDKWLEDGHGRNTSLTQNKVTIVNGYLRQRYRRSFQIPKSYLLYPFLHMGHFEILKDELTEEMEKSLFPSFENVSLASKESQFVKKRNGYL